MIGLIPCAGHATRIHGLPKYLLPLGDSYLLAILVKRMFAAGVKHVYIGANSENYEFVQRYAPEGCTVYLANTETMSETVLAARYYCGDEDVIMGMPDSYWTDEKVFQRLAPQLDIMDSVAALGLWMTSYPNQHRKLGMVDTQGGIGVRQVIDKPQETDLYWAWGVMAWHPSFWIYVLPADAHVGFAAQRAIEDKQVVVSSQNMDDYYDCGTFDEYALLIRTLTTEAVNS